MAEPNQFPTRPREARNLYAVARFDGLVEGPDPIDSFALTQGYWDEADALEQAERLNRSASEETRHFVLLVRVMDRGFPPTPS